MGGATVARLPKRARSRFRQSHLTLAEGATLYHDDDHFASGIPAHLAEEFIELLDKACDLAALRERNLSAERIAGLVAKALGGSIDFGSFPK